MKIKYFTICLLFLLSLSSCNTLSDIQEKTQEAISQGVYGTNDAMNVGRFDIAKKYSDQTIRLVPPPKTRIKVEAFYGKRLKNYDK